MKLFGWLKNTASKADDALDQTKKDIAETAEKIQETLDSSSKGVKTVVEVITVALCVSIITNIVTISLNVVSHRNPKHGIIIQNLYLGAFPDVNKK